MRSKRRRSHQEIHEAWWAWRKQTALEIEPRLCTCYIGKPFAKQGSCAKCEMCPGCEQHIQLKFWRAHEAECRALKDSDYKLLGGLSHAD